MLGPHLSTLPRRGYLQLVASSPAGESIADISDEPEPAEPPPKKKDRIRRFREYIDFTREKRRGGPIRLRPRNDRPPPRRA